MDVAIEHFAPRPSPLTTLFFEHMHGAASRVPADATALLTGSTTTISARLGSGKTPKTPTSTASGYKISGRLRGSISPGAPT